ncbi:MAG TPA: IPT/TIG domain-containing protein [Anaeromyxobacteraceae bacterium]
MGGGNEDARSRDSEAAPQDAAAQGDNGLSYDLLGGTAAGAPAVAAIQRPAASDLEYSAGLPEPPQQSVVPSPHPWAPSPDAEPNANPVIEDVWPRGGPSSGGGRVVIRGRNLRASQVLFGTSPAHIITATDGELTVAAPGEDAGEIAIAVTNDDGNYAIAAEAYRYYQ